MPLNTKNDSKVMIIGAGPGGLTAAFELAKRKISSVIIEKDEVVGGIARTVNFKGYYFDIGGHRFFTKIPRVMAMWQEILGKDFLKRPRLSRIYYKKKFFYYPIRPFDVFKKLGPKESVLVILSFLISQIKKRPQEDSLEDYIINHFGQRLYQTFFKSYTEKVWGRPCSQIKAEWAAQRIKGLNFFSLLKTALFGNRGNKIKTLIEEFYYPRFGPGEMWQRTQMLIEKSGYGKIFFESTPTAIVHDGKKVKAVKVNHKQSGRQSLRQVDALISSMPLRELVSIFEPSLSEEVRKAALSLNYRDFIMVALIINRRDIFPDNWIYIHEPKIAVGRIQNFKNWSPEMTPDQTKTSLGLEYFCNKGDSLWVKSDQEIIELAEENLEQIGLAKKEEVISGQIVRMEKTYPVYDEAYEKALPILRKTLVNFTNLYPIGRNGMHRYNNQDHAMYTAMLAIENYLGAHHDLWQVNVDRVYHEEGTGRGKRI